MAKVKIKKGFDIKLSGVSEKKTQDMANPKIVGLVPLDFRGIKVKLLKKAGEEVKAGTAVFFDKNRPEVTFSSPVSGKIKNIEYGARRVIQSISIENDEKFENEPFRSFSEPELASAERETLQNALLESGLWPHLRQRPFDKIANRKDTPKAIFISLMDTAPLAADPEYLLENKLEEFNLGLTILQKFTEGKINVSIREGSDLSGKLKKCDVHEFSGPHPAGNVGIHIHHLDPIRRGEVVWTITIQGLLAWTSFLTTGRYPSHKTIAVAGTGAENRHYVRITEGTRMKEIVKISSLNQEFRFISGNILTGHIRELEGFMGFNESLLTVIPEGKHRTFMGWIIPGFDAFSFSKTFFSSLLPKKSYNLDTNFNGGPRAFVQTGLFEQVVPMDLYPDFLLKSILAEDIAEMEGLGIYEVSEEDFALCSYIDPSKNDVCGIIRQGLELIEKEG